RLGRSERTHLRVIGRNLGEGVAPSVSLIRHEALQNAEGYLRAIGAAIMERSDHRRDVREAAVRRKKRAHFEIGVDARLRTAKELKNEAAAVNHGGVALLAAQHAGGWGTRRIGIRWEPWGARGADCSMRAGEDAIAREGKPDGGEKRGILKGIRKRRVWRCNAGRRQGENVGFSGGVHVRDADEKNHGIGGIGANGNGVRDFGGADGARLAAKPAARHQERGQAIAEFAVEPLNGAGLWSGRRHDPEKLFAKEALK